MPDRRLINVQSSAEYIYPDFEGAIPLPPWEYEEFTRTDDSELVYPLNTLKLGHAFRSPFHDSVEDDSIVTTTATTGVDIRTANVGMDFSGIVNNPPDSFMHETLINEGAITHVGATVNLKFALYLHRAFSTGAPPNSGRTMMFPVKIKVANGGKSLLKLDFMLRERPNWNSPTGFMAPAIAGFTLHEGSSIGSQEDEYDTVRERIVVLGYDPSPQSFPLGLDTSKNYSFSHVATKQFAVSGAYHQAIFSMNCWGINRESTAAERFIHFMNTGTWATMLVFVGTFSMREFHEHFTKTEFMKQWYNSQVAPNRYDDLAPRLMNSRYKNRVPYLEGDTTPVGLRYLRDGLPKTTVPLPLKGYAYEYSQGGSPEENLNLYASFLAKHDRVYSPRMKNHNPADVVYTDLVIPNSPGYYKHGSYYSNIKEVPPANFADLGGVSPTSPSQIGMFGKPLVGSGHIEAYTFDGAVPTPYKPVYLLERLSGCLIRETVSDATGKYVIQAIPKGFEYIAVSIDPTKTYASTVEDFGVIQ